jgi:hypothetical protein
LEEAVAVPAPDVAQVIVTVRREPREESKGSTVKVLGGPYAVLVPRGIGFRT